MSVELSSQEVRMWDLPSDPIRLKARHVFCSSLFLLVEQIKESQMEDEGRTPKRAKRIENDVLAV